MTYLSHIGKLSKSILALIVAGIIFSGCKQTVVADDHSAAEKNITTNVEFSAFKKQQKVTLKETGRNGFFTIITIVDTFLVCVDYRAPHLLEVFGINSEKLLVELIKRGNGSHECLNVANIILTENKNIFWIYDITLGKFLKIDIRKALENPEAYTGEEEIILTGPAKRVKSPCRINDSTFVAASYSRDDCRFFSFTKNSVMLEKTGRLPARDKKWPEESKNSPFSILASIYTANLVKHPAKDLIVAAYNTIDRLELYDHGTLKKIITGPEHVAPIVSFSGRDGKFSASQSEQTIFTHTNVFATSSFVYSLYSGKDGYNTCSKRMLVYDWNGNPEKIIEFDRPICYFFVSETSKGTIIYTVEKDNGNICIAAL